MVLIFERRRLLADGWRSLRDKRPVSHKPSAAATTADRPDERRRPDRRRSLDAVSSSVDKSVRDPLVPRDWECARAAAASCTDRRWSCDWLLLFFFHISAWDCCVTCIVYFGHNCVNLEKGWLNNIQSVALFQARIVRTSSVIGQTDEFANRSARPHRPLLVRRSTLRPCSAMCTFLCNHDQCEQ